jgi:hypothetical protein
MPKKETFELDKDGVQVKFAVLEPNAEHGKEGRAVYQQTFAECLKAGGLLRQALDKYMVEQGLWDEAKEQERRKLAKELDQCELALQKGGIPLKEARKKAIRMRELRILLQQINAGRNALDINTVEGQAENARFNTLASCCLVYNDSGERVYKDVDDYMSHITQPEAFIGAQLLAQMLYNYDKTYEQNLPENKFLTKYKFIDSGLRLINSDGKLIDTDGKLIDELGRYINSEGQLVDVDGNRVDEDGNYIVESTPFLDDDGAPIVEVSEPPSEAAPQQA